MSVEMIVEATEPREGPPATMPFKININFGELSFSGGYHIRTRPVGENPANDLDFVTVLEYHALTGADGYIFVPTLVTDIDKKRFYYLDHDNAYRIFFGNEVVLKPLDGASDLPKAVPHVITESGFSFPLAETDVVYKKTGEYMEARNAVILYQNGKITQPVPSDNRPVLA